MPFVVRLPAHVLAHAVSHRLVVLEAAVGAVVVGVDVGLLSDP